MHTNIFSEIAEGVTYGEDPLDVYQICFASAVEDISNRKVILKDRGPFISDTTLSDGSKEYGVEFRATLKLYAKIWCPIFDVVKPRDYIENMTKVRKSYEGITLNNNAHNDLTFNLKSLFERNIFTELLSVIFFLIKWQLFALRFLISRVSCAVDVILENHIYVDFPYRKQKIS